MVLTVWSSSSSWLFPFSSSPQKEWVHSGTIVANLILLPLLMMPWWYFPDNPFHPYHSYCFHPVDWWSLLSICPLAWPSLCLLPTNRDHIKLMHFRADPWEWVRDSLLFPGSPVKPRYGFLYRATLDVFPGTFLLVSTACLGIIFILVLFVHKGWAKRKLNQFNNM